MAEENLPGPGLAISDKGGFCRVFSPAAPIFVVQGTVVGTARQNISMAGCCRLPFGTRLVIASSGTRHLQSLSRTSTPSSGSSTNSAIRIASRRSTRSASAVGCVQRRSQTTFGGGPKVVVVEIVIGAHDDKAVGFGKIQISRSELCMRSTPTTWAEPAYRSSSR